MMSISPVSGQGPLPSSQNAGHTPRASGMRMRASARPKVKSNLLLESIRPDTKSALRSACGRSEEHTSELQSPCNLVCRLLLEKKKKQEYHNTKRSIIRQGVIRDTLVY